jgi:hypothetical protein
MNMLQKSIQVPTYDNAGLMAMVEMDDNTEAVRAEIQSLLHPSGKIQQAFRSFNDLFKSVSDLSQCCAANDDIALTYPGSD